jgi:hypothetical protein
MWAVARVGELGFEWLGGWFFFLPIVQGVSWSDDELGFCLVRGGDFQLGQLTPVRAEFDGNSVNFEGFLLIGLWYACLSGGGFMLVSGELVDWSFWEYGRAGDLAIPLCQVQLKLMMLPFTCMQLRVTVADFADGRFCGYGWFCGKHSWDEGWRTQPVRRVLVRVEILWACR